jgi:hypothetical protein
MLKAPVLRVASPEGLPKSETVDFNKCHIRGVIRCLVSKRLFEKEGGKPKRMPPTGPSHSLQDARVALILRSAP